MPCAAYCGHICKALYYGFVFLCSCVMILCCCVLVFLCCVAVFGVYYIDSGGGWY